MFVGWGDVAGGCKVGETDGKGRDAATVAVGARGTSEARGSVGDSQPTTTVVAIAAMMNATRLGLKQMDLAPD